VSKNRRKRRAATHKTRRYGRRSRTVDPLALAGGAVAVLAALLAISAWRSGVFAKPPDASRGEDPATLLPLAEAAVPLYGWHDMARIPRQTPAPRAVPADEPGPRIDLPSTSHDFGPVYETWDVVHTFAIQNTGEADLLIANLVTSCGCTVAELSSSAIPPNQRADLTVTFDAGFHDAQGEVTRLVWFATNDPAHPWIEVHLTADVQ